MTIAPFDEPVKSTVRPSDMDRKEPTSRLPEAFGSLTFTGDVMLSGLDYIRETFRDTYAGLESQDNTIIEKRVRILSPDVAIVIATSEGTYTDKAGWTSEPVGMGHTLVFVRENGEWRARHVHQSIAP